MTDPLTEAELLSRLVGMIYDAVFDDRLWDGVLETLCTYVRGASANLFWQEATGDGLAVIHEWGQDPAYAASYRTTYSGLNPLYPAATFLEVGEIYSSGDLIAHEDFQATRFFREWAEPQGIVDALGVNLQRYAASAATLSVQRSAGQGYVDGAMRRRFAMIVPHVRRAVLIGRELGRVRLHAGALEAVLGEVSAAVFLLDAAGGTTFVNPGGERLLAARDLVTWREGRLALADGAGDRVLRAAIAAAAETGQIAGPAQILLRDRDDAAWIGHAMPIAGARRDLSQGGRPVLGLFLRKAEIHVASGVELVARRHHLTPGEVRVLAAALDHATAEEVALALGVATSTVKTHLAAIYAKTGSSRRADLVRLVAAHGGMPA